MKLGDLFYTRVSGGKLVCYQLFYITTNERLDRANSKPKIQTDYSFRRVDLRTLKSKGNCSYGLSEEEANKRFKPLTDAARVLFAKEQV